MSDDKMKYGNPTSEHLVMMKTKPSRIVNLDLTDHLKANYPEEKSKEHIEEIKRVRDCSKQPQLSEEYCDAVDESVSGPFRTLCKKHGLKYPDSLIKELSGDADYYILTLKYHFNRKRPYQSGPANGIKMIKGETKTSATPAYPSGHSAQARMISTVLSRIYPSIRKECEVVADSVDRTRLDLGVHYPSDLSAGKKLGKHMGLVANLNQEISESTLVDPDDTEIVSRVGYLIVTGIDINVTNLMDAVKAMPGITTARQAGPAIDREAARETRINLFVNIVANIHTPQTLRRMISNLEGVKRVVIKNVDGERYAVMNRKEQTEIEESLVRDLVSEIFKAHISLNEELTKSDKKEIERISKKAAKKEIDTALRSFKKSDLEKEIGKVLGSKSTKEELSNITKAVIKRLYRELSVNYPAIIDRIKT